MEASSQENHANTLQDLRTWISCFRHREDAGFCHLCSSLFFSQLIYGARAVVCSTVYTQKFRYLLRSIEILLLGALYVPPPTHTHTIVGNLRLFLTWPGGNSWSFLSGLWNWAKSKLDLWELLRNSKLKSKRKQESAMKNHFCAMDPFSHQILGF